MTYTWTFGCLLIAYALVVEMIPLIVVSWYKHVSKVCNYPLDSTGVSAYETPIGWAQNISQQLDWSHQITTKWCSTIQISSKPSRLRQPSRVTKHHYHHSSLVPQDAIQLSNALDSLKSHSRSIPNHASELSVCLRSPSVFWPVEMAKWNPYIWLGNWVVTSGLTFFLSFD